MIADHTAFIANGSTVVFAADLVTGRVRWQVKLDGDGFDWGNATVGAPAYANGIVLVPTLYADLVALNADTGAELWRHRGKPSAIRTTHYRGKAMAGYEAQPVVTGDVVWAAGTDGTLSALELQTGAEVWSTELGTPLLAAPAVSGRWLVVAGFDGVVRGLATAEPRAAITTPVSCEIPAGGGCCGGGGSPPALAVVMIAFGLRRRRR
jgi:outer membrane protein assembly factor BamB